MRAFSFPCKSLAWLAGIFLTADETADAAGSTGGSSPVAKIAETMSNLLQSMQEEASTDLANYKQVFQWCQTSWTSRQNGHAQYQALENELRAKIKVSEAMNRQLKDEVAQLEAEIQEASAAIGEGNGLRGNEHADYLSEQKEAANMLSVLNSASTALSQSQNREALLAVASSVKQISRASGSSGLAITEEQRNTLDNWARTAQQQSAQDAEQQGSSASSDMIENTQAVAGVLKDLARTFEGSIANAQTQERSALEQYDGLIRLKRNSLLQLQASKDSKDAALAESEQRIAQLKRSIEDAKVVTQTSANYLQGLKKICADGSNEWAGRNQLRQDILDKLERAEESLKGGNEQQQQPMQLSASFVQLGMGTSAGASASLSSAATGKTKSASASQAAAAQSSASIFGDLGMVAPDFSAMFSSSPSSGVKSALAAQSRQVQPSKASLAQLSATTTAAAAQQQQVLQQPPQLQAVPMNVQQQPSAVEQMGAQQSPALMGAGGLSVYNSETAQQNSYPAVKRMIEQMIAQIQAATLDENKHKNWCEAEIGKNQAIADDKKTKLTRMQTKVDNERQSEAEIEDALKVLENEQKNLKGEFEAFVQLRKTGKAFFRKAESNHQVANQILQQAVVILQRFAAFVQESQLRDASTTFLANENHAQSTNEQTQQTVGALQALATRYQQLHQTGSSAENESALDLELLQKQGSALLSVLSQTRTYRGNLKLQAASELDSDVEDVNALKKQQESVADYLARLRVACADILQHYEERRGRREENLKALENARNIINIDNADEIHSQLSTLAGGVDSAAEKLLQASSTGGKSMMSTTSQQSMSAASGSQLVALSPALLSAPQASGSGLGGSVNVKPQPMGASGGSLQSNILGDLQSLQNLSSEEQAERGQVSNSLGGVLNMLPA